MVANKEIRESLVQHTGQRRRFRVHMLNKSQKAIRNSVKQKLQLKKFYENVKNTGREIRKEMCPKFECSRNCITNCLHEIFPFMKIMRRYSLRKYLLSDVVAGITVGIVHIPQGMAYGFLSQLPPIYGLYTSFIPVLLYFFFGSSRHISMGTFAVVSLMIGTVVTRGYQIYGETPDNVTTVTNYTDATTTKPRFSLMAQNLADPVKLGFALSVTFVIGCVQLTMGICRLGFLASFLSDPLISGFTTGAAVHVISSQIKHIFGIPVGEYHGPLNLLYFYSEFFLNIRNTNMVTLAASITCVLVLVLIKDGINGNENCKKDIPIPIPIELILIIVSTLMLMSYYAKLERDFGVEVVGHIPKGLPNASVFHLRYVTEVLGDGVVIGIVAYTISYSMAKILADKHNYRINPNQVVSLVSSFIVLIVVLYIGPLFESLPECILASIVIVTVKGMFQQLSELKRLWGLCRKDFIVWLGTFVAVVVLDIALGLLTGVVLSLYFVLRHTQKPQMSMLGQIPGTGAYKDVNTTNEVQQVPGIKIFQFETSIYFANAEHFRDKLLEKTGLYPDKLKRRKKHTMHDVLKRRQQELEQAELERKKDRQKKEREGKQHSAIEIVVVDKETDRLEKEREKKLLLDRFVHAWQPPIKTLIIDVTVVNYIDSVAVKCLMQVVNDYKEVGIKVFLAGCKPDVRAILRQANFYSIVDHNILYYTVHEAVVIAQEINQEEMKPSWMDVKLLNEMSNKTQGKGEEEDDEEEEEQYETSPEDDLDSIETGTCIYKPYSGDVSEVARLHQTEERMFDSSRGRRKLCDSDGFELISLTSPS
ncbi:hypothetical protein ACJMK2_017335 [Sinanodonta woodiana]|uniref:STAS domain-containing protein n=1 Tax=Sinanodonta woodiana TaxID=1069815 RepID=A0ABD3UWK8_SINWO